MIAVFAVGVISAGLLLAARFFRARSVLRTVVVVALALAGLTAWAPARVAAAGGSTPQSGARTMALVHPLAASHASAPGRDFAPTAATYNPGTGGQGFGVFVQGNATLGATSTNGPVAMGGNLTVGSNFSVASQTAGTFTASGDSQPTGLLVGGSINWSGSNSGGAVNVGSSAYVKVGNMTGSVIPNNGNNPTHIVPTGGNYGSKPQIALNVAQPSASVNQSGLINFASAFSAFSSQSTDMATCVNSVTLNNQNGTPLSFPLSPGTNASVTLTPGTQNVLDISAANLANISTLNFNNSPTSTMPLIINVNTSGVANNFSWTPGNFNGIQSSGVPYTLWNFSTATQVTIAGSSTVPGTIYAPGATVNDNDQNGLNGSVIAAAYAQGGVSGSPNGGQLQYAPFAGTVTSCAAPQLTISLSAGTSTSVPGGTVHYTVSVTNSGTAAYSAATFTDSLSGVLDDAAYNSDASASSGSVSYTSPNLTWTGSLAAGAAATITFSVTVNNPDTGDKSLVSTVTSTSTGSNCASGSTDSRCSSTVPVSVLIMAVTASTQSTTPGATVSYTVTITNSGPVAVTGAALTDSLSGVLDDATYNGNATATAGSVTYTSPNLAWTGNLAAAAVATITFSVTVNNPDTGDKSLATTVTSATAGSNCPSGSTDTRCASTVTVLVPSLTLALTASTATPSPGTVVTYTIKATNSGQTAYTGAAFTDSLSGLLDDATYNSNATATAGSVSYTSPNLAWTGNLAVGAVATITFSVTVNNPDTGDKNLSTTVTSATAGSNCPAGSTDSRCASSIQVLVPGLAISVSAGSPTTTPGATVRYTVTVTNTGGTAYTGAAFTDPLGDVLDDASYNGDAIASAGTVSFASPNLSWTGNLAVGAVATVTFSVTVSNPDTGNKTLASTITSATAGSNCPAGSPAASCTATVNVAVLTIINSAGVSSTTPGSVVRFTTTFTNSGQVPYTGITIATNITDVLDDATPNGDQTATSGTLSLTATGISWTGSIPVGGTVTVTGTVTVNNPDTGNKLLASTIATAAPGSNCPAGGTDPRCSVSVPVLVPALTISATASTSTAVPGTAISYTVTVTNSGQTAYTGATFTDSLAGALDDATYDGDAAATAGLVTYSSPNLTWTGNLAVGATATVTFSVTVNNPDTGDKVIMTTITSSTVGSTCPVGGNNPGCTVTVAGLTPALTIAATASSGTTTPGAVVHYTVTVTDSGQTPYTGASASVSLAGVLDDAAYDGDAAATAGSVSFASPSLTWTGNLAVGGTATITYSATVNNPDTGDHILASTVTSAAAGSNCGPGGTDPRCSSSVPVAQLTILNVANVPTTTPGSVVRFTATFTNAGQVAYTGITISANLSSVFADASNNGDQTASSGTLTVTSTGIAWTGSIPVGGTVTVTGTVTVDNPYTGNSALTNTFTTSAPGSNCPAGTTDPRCTVDVPVLIPGLTIVKTANVSTTTPGSVVGYTVTVTDSGQTPYTGAAFSDSLSGLLADAAYNGDAAASTGSVSYAAPVLTWTGNLAVGQTATVTYSVTVDNPDTGDKTLSNTVTSPTVGSDCPAAGTDPRCTATVQDLVPGLTIAASAASGTTTPGSVVHYTVTAENTGQTTDTGVSFSDALAGVLDDATYNGDAAATVGSVSFASPNLTWTGSLAPGATATVTFSVTVSNPDTGNGILASTVTSAAAGSNCAAGSTDPRCSATVTVSQLAIVSTPSVGTVMPGAVVNETTTITNTGQAPYHGISVSFSTANTAAQISDVGNETASSGTLSVGATGAVWTGDVPVGGTVTITGSIIVASPYPAGGQVIAITDATTAPGSNCPAGGTDPRCTMTVNVVIPGLTIVKTADTSVAVPGSVVGYTVTVTDSGQTPYPGAVVADDLSGVVDDATYGGDAVASAGSVSYAAPVLTWTGSLVPGGSATFTYSVTVNSPDAGDKLLVNTVSSAAVGSSCPPGATTTSCQLTIPVLTPALTIVQTAATTSGSSAVATPGGVVSYTISVTNTGQTPYTGAAFTESLAGVLDDATYNSNAAATAGSVTFASPVLSWAGDLAPGASAVITYSVTVDNPDTGDKSLEGTVVSPTAGSNCPVGGTDARCRVTVTVVGATTLTFTQTAAASSAVAGGKVSYTITIANSGASVYAGAAFSDPLSGVLDDAAWDGDAVASSGTLTFASPTVSWVGDVPAGGTVTITYSVTVDNPDTGNMVLTSTTSSSSANSNCPAASPGPRCTATVTVSQLAIDFTVSAATVSPGGALVYTATFTNTGQTPYFGISVDTDTTELSANATSGGAITTSSGTLSVGATGSVWTGDIPVGGTVTITSPVIVDKPVTNSTLTATAVSAAPGSSCPLGSTDPRCTPVTTVLTPGLTISQVPNTTAAVPGQSVGFTVTITDSGQTPYAGAVVTDSFAGLADDGAYDGNALASAGTLSYAAPVLTWTGDLLPGATVTITYTVTVDDPDTGDKLLISALASAATGSSCPPETTSSPCRVTIPVLTPALTIVAAASTASAVPGQTVTYTVTVTDSGQTPYTGAALADDLSGTLDDAVYNNNAAAAIGSVSYAAPNLTWTGDLAPGDSATITYTVTVHNPDTGDHVLASAITSAVAGGNCPSGGTDPRCATTVDVSDLTIVNTASTPTTTPGGVVGYTVTVTNSGQVPLPGVTVTAALAPVLDDATYNADAAATAGTVTLAGDGQSLTWTGNLVVGATVTITYSVTVNNPDTGDKTLTDTVASATPGSSCPAGSPNPDCTAVTTVLVPGLTIANAASTSTPVPGAVVTYTLTITNTGQTAYTGITVTDTIAQMLDDVAYNNDAAATAGSVSYAAGIITWAGDLAPGGTATVTFSVTVDNPDTGDKTLIAAAASAAPGSTCPPGTTTAPCRSTTGVLTPALEIVSTADASTTVPGATVDYTITITDTGQTPYTGATITVPLTDVLDDAAYNNDAAASTGTVSYANPTLTWTGSLVSGDTATITYAVTISNPDTGNHILASTLTSSSPGSNCPSGGTDPRCTATVTVSQLVIDFTASAPTVTPGGALVYTATLTNAGQTPYFGISVSTDTIGLAANTTSAGNTTASSGTLSIGATGAVWTGDIPVGGTVTITSPVTVNNPVTSDTLTATAVSTAPGSNCPPGSADPRCTPVTQILTPGLSIVTTANTSAAVPGQTVAYTVTVTDTGQTPYTGATVTETLNLLDDATYNDDAAVTTGTVSYASPVITWTGDLAVGASAVVTYTVTVSNPDTGDKNLNTVAVSTDPGSSCPPASSNPGCNLSIPVLTPALTIIKTASTATATPGQTVTYTVTVTDSGQVPYTGAAFSDSLSGVLADARYNNNAAASSGTVSYASPVISWTGDLTVGATATITYTVTVDNPDTGRHVLTNTISSVTAGNNCPAASTDPRCTATVDISALTIVNTASVSTTVPGSTVAYTVTITNTGQTTYTGVSVTDPLAGVLDDAVFNNDANTTAGSVSYASPNLIWTGDLAVGSTATITFSVTVNNPDTGDKTLTSTVTSAAAGNNCPAGGTDPSCTATVSVLTPALAITKTATASTTTPGSTVGFTITVTDSGQTPYSGITVTDPLSGVLSDGVYNNNATATSGSVSYASPTLTWTGDLAVGATATITYTVTVNNPDTGDKTLINTVASSATGSNCPAGGTDPACTATVQVLVPALTITKTATVSTTTPGSTVGYIITVADSGQTPYAGAQVTDSLAGVLGDAAYNGNATASAGTVGYASPTLTWTGDLALGEVVTISYSVTVNDPDTGGRLLANTVVSSDAGSDCQVGSADPRCAVTVPVMAGTLSMTAPISANLGLTGPGGSVSASLGTVEVTDNRGFGADWTATVSATGFTTGNGTAAETVPASDASYAITGFVSTTGTANFSVAPETTLSGDPQPVVSATNVGGGTSATWDPVIDVQVPATAIAGQYTATIVHSVS